MPLIANEPNVDGLFEFQMLCTGARCAQAVDGMMRYTLDLHDYRGHHEVSMSEAAMDHFLESRPIPVRVLSGDPECLTAPDVIRMVEVIPWDQVRNVPSLFPLTWCPFVARPALAELVKLVEGLQDPDLHRFLNRVLAAPEIRTKLLGTAASREYHHAYAGGLLAHMVDGLPVLNRLCWTAGFTRKEFEISQVAYLLHDLGKVTCRGGRADHRALTLALIQPYLASLKADDPAIGATLEHCVHHACAPIGRRENPGFVGATFVTWADRYSTALQRGGRMNDFLSSLEPALMDTDYVRMAA